MVNQLGFIGKHDVRFDDKGRLTIPARFKAVLQQRFGEDDMQVVVSLTPRMTLRVESVSQYNARIEKIMAYDELDEATREVQDLFTAYASPERVDSSGRIRVPQELRDLAGLDRDATCTGRINEFEVWDRQRWSESQSKLLQDPQALLERMREKNKA